MRFILDENGECVEWKFNKKNLKSFFKVKCSRNCLFESFFYKLSRDFLKENEIKSNKLK